MHNNQHNNQPLNNYHCYAHSGTIAGCSNIENVNYYFVRNCNHVPQSNRNQRISMCQLPQIPQIPQMAHSHLDVEQMRQMRQARFQPMSSTSNQRLNYGKPYTNPTTKRTETPKTKIFVSNIFDDFTFALFESQPDIESTIIANGGAVCKPLNREIDIDYILVSSGDEADCNDIVAAQMQAPIIDNVFIYDCLKSNKMLNYKRYIVKKREKEDDDENEDDDLEILTEKQTKTKTKKKKRGKNKKKRKSIKSDGFDNDIDMDINKKNKKTKKRKRPDEWFVLLDIPSDKIEDEIVERYYVRTMGQHYKTWDKRGDARDWINDNNGKLIKEK